MKIYRIIPFLFLGMIMLFSCKQDTRVEQPKVEVKTTESISKELPDPCTFMNEAFVSNLIGLPAENVTIKSGGNSATVPAKSCFFKWTGGEVANAGVMVQTLGNPVPDEFPDWAFFFIDNKKAQGERTVEEPDVALKYTTMPGIGDQACYNLELAKCYFRKDQTVYMIALNGISGDDNRMKTFETVAKHVLEQV